MRPVTGTSWNETECMEAYKKTWKLEHSLFHQHRTHVEATFVQLSRKALIMVQSKFADQNKDPEWKSLCQVDSEVIFWEDFFFFCQYVRCE